MQNRLLEMMAALDGARIGASFAEAGTRALLLDAAYSRGPRDQAFLTGDEFAHLHLQPGDGALHMTLPEADIESAEHMGWGERHPLAGKTVAEPHVGREAQTLMVPWSNVLIFGPRDGDELKIVWRLVLKSYAFARGD